MSFLVSVFFFFNDTATTEIYTLSLHDALPIFGIAMQSGSQATRNAADIILLHDSFGALPDAFREGQRIRRGLCRILDRKSTRLNSSHANISYAVFCLKKKKITLHISAMYVNCT